MDIFVGGGGDDLSWLGLGVVRAYAADLAAVAGRPVLYAPNARPARLRRAIVSAARDGRSVNLIGHSWGAIDAFDAAASALRDGLRVANLAPARVARGRLLAERVRGLLAAGRVGPPDAEATLRAQAITIAAGRRRPDGDARSASLGRRGHDAALGRAGITRPIRPCGRRPFSATIRRRRSGPGRRRRAAEAPRRRPIP
jgi:pimeloyl-ACP methyl ester carboxylesterase